MTAPSRSRPPGPPPAFLGAILAACLVAGCAAPPRTSEASHQRQAELAACRSRADTVYAKQNRGAVYAGPDQSFSPFSSTGLSGVTSAGLSTRKDYGDMVSDCLNGSLANTGGVSAVPDPGAAPSPARPSGPPPSSPATGS